MTCPSIAWGRSSGEVCRATSTAAPVPPPCSTRSTPCRPASTLEGRGPAAKADGGSRSPAQARRSLRRECGLLGRSPLPPEASSAVGLGAVLLVEGHLDRQVGILFGVAGPAVEVGDVVLVEGRPLRPGAVHV